MRFFKLIATVLILGLIALFIWQNLPTLTTQLSFKLDFFIAEPLLWTLSVYTLAIVTAAVGLVIGLAAMLKPLFTVRHRLAQLREEIGEKAAQAEAQPE